MRSSVLFPALLAAGILLLHGVSTIPSQVPEADEVPVGQGGSATFPIRLTTSLDDVAGVQGLFRYDPSRVSELTLAISPLQPGSFVLNMHEPALGEVRFVVYSISHTINAAEPFLVCRIKSKESGDASEDSSVVVVDLTAVATPDGQPHASSQRYLNVPIRVMPNHSPTGESWFLH